MERLIARLRASQDEDSRAAAHIMEQQSEQITDLEVTLSMRWKADMQAINRWREAHPDKEVVWPDHTDLLTWLLSTLDK